MHWSEIDRFPAGVGEKLKWYVYRLIDPRDGETFYVGKGKDNRVFAHIRGEIDPDEDDDGELDAKLKRVFEIHAAGFSVAHVIHRHGLEEKTAFEVEAALIDAYPGLTNSVLGTGSNEFGSMHAKEIIDKYEAPIAEFQHRAMLIIVNRMAQSTDLYSATRFAWRISRAKAERAEVVLAVVKGVIRGAFCAHEWLDATPENFPPDWNFPPPGAKRIGFRGIPAPEELSRLYVGKRVPDEYRKPGAAAPVKYTYK